MTKFLQFFIKAYAVLISPLLERSCRFHPTCSAYAHQALEKHGAAKGLYLAARRILRCHPWHTHPYEDPVPEHYDWPIAKRRMMGYKNRKPQ